MFNLSQKKISPKVDRQVTAYKAIAPSKVFPQDFPNFQQRMKQSGRAMLIADMIALTVAFVDGALLAWALRIAAGDGTFQDLFSLITLRHLISFWAVGVTTLLWLDSRGHYRQRLPYWEATGDIISVASVGFIVSGFFEFASHNSSSRLWIAFSWILFAIIALIGRNIVRHLLHKNGAWQIPAVMIGEGETAASALRTLSRDSYVGFTVVEQLPPLVLSDMNKTSAWKQVLMLHDAHYIFLALEGSEIEHYRAALKSLPRARVPFSIIPPWQGLPSSSLTAHHFMMQDVTMLHDTNRLKLPLPRLIKRVVDVTLAGLALVVLSPLLAAIALVVRHDGGKAFFKQLRVGRQGQLFACYKFRSMRVDAEQNLARYLAENPEATEEWNTYQKLKHDVRVTRVGAFLRRTSLDELPQLINVLKGDMSLVGPRPCMQGQESMYAEDFSFYESVRPGITGPWQVSGRNHLTFKERVALEAWYARNWSLWLDIVIILKTIPTVLRKEQAF
jgi:Undecaprenyl-phosphate galactose phosphotransferase WbaP